ncbi:hypothetical protein Tco_0829151 [Tanacetum coccineum]
MYGNIAHLLDFKDFDGGYVTFGGGANGGRITGKGTIKTDKLDFEDVYFVKELKFNLFSVSQMCDKKTYVLFTDSECIVLSPNFKLHDENQILLKIPRQNNMYSFDMKNIVPKDGLTCLVAKATSEESITKDETSEILKNFIKEIENLVDKGKAILIEEEPKKKSKKELEQERLSYAEAIRLEEKMNEEQRAQIARDEEILKLLGSRPKLFRVYLTLETRKDEGFDVKTKLIMQSTVSSTPTYKIFTRSSNCHVIGDVRQSAIQTRRMDNFRVSIALNDPDMGRERQCKKNSYCFSTNVWVLVDLLRDIGRFGTKWVYRNKNEVNPPEVVNFSENRGNRLIFLAMQKQTVVATSTLKLICGAAKLLGQVLWIKNQWLDYGYNFMNTVILPLTSPLLFASLENPVQPL